jgi:hypothetical protein
LDDGAKTPFPGDKKLAVMRQREKSIPAFYVSFYGDGNAPRVIFDFSFRNVIN